MHVDLFQNVDGKLLKIPFGKGIPQPEKEHGLEEYTLEKLLKKNYGILKWGNGKGKPCKDVCDEEILNCIQNSQNKDYTVQGNNCQAQAENALRDCCLVGYNKAFFSFLSPFLPG